MNKKRVFWSMDHITDDQIVAPVRFLASQANINLEEGDNRAELIKQIRKAKTNLYMASPLLRNRYEAVQDDQYPSPDVPLATWLMKNQNKAMANEQIQFMDFRAPIEMECLILPSKAT